MKKDKTNVGWKEKSFFERVPHAITMIFSIIVFVTLLTYILPAGAYERIELNGRSTVVPNSYKTSLRLL